MTTQTLNNEMKALINDSNFRKVAASAAKKMGVTTKEWNENKMMILISFAAEVIAHPQYEIK